MDRTPPTLPPVLDDPPLGEVVADRTLPDRAATRTRRVRRRALVEGRRLGSAGSALAVCALALALAAVLNAPGTHKKAFNQPDGRTRDVALALTGPLATVSHALFLDRPRVGLQALAGRSGADDIDTEFGTGGVASGPPTAKPSPATPRTKPAFTPARPLRLYIAGDSLVIVPAFAILRAAAANPAIEPVGRVDGRVATGLTRPDVFNWFDEIRARLRSTKARMVVLSFGGNDTNSYMTGVPDGVSIGGFGEPTWTREYRRRVAALFDLVARAGAHAIWIGLPQVRDEALTGKFDVLNAAVAAEAGERPRSVTFVDTYLRFAGGDGRFAEYLPRPGGGQLKVRADDGVHFEPAGGDIVADEVLKAIAAAYDVTSWRKSRTP